MFSYCKEGNKVIIEKLSEYMLESLNWDDSKGNIVSTNIVNKWDRKEISTKFMESYLVGDSIASKYKKIGGVSNKIVFVRDLAYEVDLLLPKLYYIKYNALNGIIDDAGVVSNSFAGKNSHDITKDLLYKYTCNIQKEIKKYPKGFATEKQVAYIKHLAKLKGVGVRDLDKLTIALAPKLIAYLSGRGNNPDLILKYVVNK